MEGGEKVYESPWNATMVEKLCTQRDDHATKTYIQTILDIDTKKMSLSGSSLIEENNWRAINLVQTAHKMCQNNEKFLMDMGNVKDIVDGGSHYLGTLIGAMDNIKLALKRVGFKGSDDQVAYITNTIIPQELQTKRINAFIDDICIWLKHSSKTRIEFLLYISQPHNTEFKTAFENYFTNHRKFGNLFGANCIDSSGCIPTSKQ
jgi:hypothetical protein